MLSFLSPFPRLPKYTGPHHVGSVELEIPLQSLGLEAAAEVFAISTIKFRAFYPAPAQATEQEMPPWLPEPQDAHLEGYMKLAQLNPWISSILLSIPRYLRSTKIPVYSGVPLLYDGNPLPVCIFSHGLVGGMNTHSALLGELASYGLVCIAVEHRDGSGALSLVRTGQAPVSDLPTEITSVYYKRISLKIKPGAYEERDKQLRIRLFELAAIFHALELINGGKSLENLASTSDSFAFPKRSLNLKPGSVIWAGHSFGGSTLIQFLKSIYYEGNRQQVNKDSLLWQNPSESLAQQIQPTSPVVLLDPWFLPLKSPATEWLYIRPLPCHDNNSLRHDQAPTTVNIGSSEFAFHWPECHSHMDVVLAADPKSVKVQTEAEYHEEFQKYRSPRHFIDESKMAKAASKSIDAGNNKSAPEKGSEQRAVTASFVLHDTTHVTHSDFGLLFPWVTRWFTGQKDPELAIANIAQRVLRTAGLRNGASGVETAQLEQIWP